nr:MAG TPA: restriction enzyme [Caudoviricetes sp.]
MGKINKEYLYKVGQVVNGLEILEQTRKQYSRNSVKAYKCKCVKCGFGNGCEPYYNKSKEYIEDGAYWVAESSLKQGCGCPCCRKIPQVTIPNINSIWALRKDLISYFIDVEDSKKYMPNSHNKIKLKCPNCGTIKEMDMYTLNQQGFSCTSCSDGVSYPEKVMTNILEQLGVKYTAHYNPYWSRNNTLNNADTNTNGKAYDFYFRLNEDRYIIETHGEQHYNGSFSRCGRGRSLAQEQLNDGLKKRIALTRCRIANENYIVIDCRRSEIDFIRNNILHSRLNEVFDLSIIDWDKVAKDSEKNLVKEICEYWNNNYNNVTTKDVAEVFNVDRTTVIRYLKKGTKLNWLNIPYDGKVENIRAKKIKQSGVNSPVAQKTYIYNKDMELLYVGGTQKDCASWLFNNGFVGSAESGRSAIKTHKDTNKAYLSNTKLNEPLYIFTHEITAKDKKLIEKPIKYCIYLKDMELLYCSYIQKHCGQWLVDNGFVGTISSGQDVIQRNKDTDKLYTSKAKPHEPLYFYTYEIGIKETA